MSIDWSRPVRTKLGEILRVLCTDAPGKQPVVVIDGNGVPSTFHLDGHYQLDRNPSSLDLENVPEERYVWVNFYPNYNENYVNGSCHASRAKADEASKRASDDRIACIKMKVVDGQFDD